MQVANFLCKLSLSPEFRIRAVVLGLSYFDYLLLPTQLRNTL